MGSSNSSSTPAGKEPTYISVDELASLVTAEPKRDDFLVIGQCSLSEDGSG